MSRARVVTKRVVHGEVSEHLGYVNDDQLHRWLDVEGVVVDITADQFGESAVVVSAESPWHHDRPIQERLAFDEHRVEFLRSAPMADYTRQVFGRIAEIVEGGIGTIAKR